MKVFDYATSSMSRFFSRDAAAGPDDGVIVSKRGQAQTEGQGPDSHAAVQEGSQESHDRSKDSVTLSQEAIEVQRLQDRDREVRAHEAAHANAGGAYAGAPSYTTKRGPDGKTYATGGAVSIDISPIKGDPQATLQKAEQVRAAALAPAQPSAQDMKVAQKAQVMAAKARRDLADNQVATRESINPPTEDNSDDTTSSVIPSSPRTPAQPSTSTSDASGTVQLSIRA